MDTQNNNLPFKANEVISILQTAPDGCLRPDTCPDGNP